MTERRCPPVLTALLVTLAFALAGPAPAVRAQEVIAPSADPSGEPLSQQQLYCGQLEQALAMAMQQQNQGGATPSQLDAQIRKYDRLYQQGEAQAKQQDCYDFFFFSTSYRNTPRCQQLAQQIENAKSMLQQLEQQRAAVAASHPDTTQRDAIVDELAHNSCGQQYVLDAKRRHNQNPFAALFGGENPDAGYDPSLAQPGFPGYGQPGYGQQGFGTYRTLCVRLCDGYYFPISFATLPQSFAKDASQCTSQCAAPAKLFVYQNPGAEVDAAASLDGMPYTQLPNAWRYRKQLVAGCSCKQAEYDPAAAPDGKSAGLGAGQGTEQLPWQQKQGSPQDAIGSLLGDGQQQSN